MTEVIPVIGSLMQAEVWSNVIDNGVETIWKLIKSRASFVD